MKNFIKNYIIKNWQYKLLSFFIAFILWLYVVNSQVLNIKLNLPVEFDNLPPNLKIIDKDFNNVEILLEARRDIIRSIDKSNLKVKIDLKNAKEGKYNYIITSKRIENLPDGVMIKDINPSKIVLVFQAVKTEQGSNNNSEKKKE